MKKVFLTFISLTAATLLLLLIPSCSGLVSPTVPDSDSESTPNAESQRYTLSGSFSMPNADAAPQEISALSSPQRNAIPDTSSLTYTVEAKRSDGYTETTASDGSTYTFTNLTAGTWQITAYASTTGGTRVMQSETKSVTLSSTNPYATTSLELTPSSGTGGIGIQVNWAADSKIGYCSWAFSGITNSGNNTNSPFNITAESIPSGTYALTLDFYTSNTNATNGAKPIYSCTEYVSVYAGLTTNSWTASTAPHIGSDGSFSVTKECVETFVYRKIYVKQGADDSTATGTSERPFPTIEKAMERLTEAASKGIRSGEITASNPWELHVSGTFTATEIIGEAFITVTDPITHLAIIGEGSGATIDANSLGRIVYVTGNSSSVSMENITLQNGRSTQGGAVYIDNGASFTMESGTITGNTATYEGGGVYASSGYFYMNGGTISGNTATDDGGGVYCNGMFEMNDGTISGNSAMNGKGVYIESNGVFTMLDGTITANTGTMGTGGGVYNSNTFEMHNGTISENSASGGNGVYVAEAAYFTMYNGTISGNTSFGDGGGVYISGTTDGVGTFEMYGGTISGNTATQDGGGVCVGNGGTDGAIFNMYEGSTIKGNTAQGGSSSTGKGGGVYSSGTFTMYGGTIGGSSAGDENKAEGNSKNGGGVYVAMHTFDMQGGTIEGNTVAAGGNGSGVYNANTFKMGSSAYVKSGNDVYLPRGKKIEIDYALAGQPTPVATITPEGYSTTNNVIDNNGLTLNNHMKFAVTPRNGTEPFHVGKTGNLEAGYLATSDTIGDVVGNLTANNSKIVIIGMLDSNKLQTIATAVAGSSKTIELDLTQATISSNITLSNEFSNCTKLTSIAFDGSKINPANAFQYCENLQTFKVTASTYSGGFYLTAFQGCTSLRIIDLTECTYVCFDSYTLLSSNIGTTLQRIKLGSGLATLTLYNFGSPSTSSYVRQIFDYDGSSSDFISNVNVIQSAGGTPSSGTPLITSSDGDQIGSPDGGDTFVVLVPAPLSP